MECGLNTRKIDKLKRSNLNYSYDWTSKGKERETYILTTYRRKLLMYHTGKRKKSNNV